MKLSDQKFIEFLSKSPLKSFSTMLDALRYIDGNWIPQEIEYELFDDALGDNPGQTAKIRVPVIRGIPANALFAFMQHALAFNLIRRRPKAKRELGGEAHEEIVVFYELTSSGGYAVKLLEILSDVSALAAQG
jgi:hypothetical protein